MENYESLGIIGEGTYGVVMRARHRETGHVVAIKKFKESDEDEQVRKTSLREVRVLKQLRHDNVISLLEVFRRKGKLYLVFEFVEKTILEHLERRPQGLDPQDVRRYMWQLLRGVEYCHRHKVIHRDIKPENILIAKSGALKLCDFGFARAMSSGGKYTDYVATRWYRGPELLVGDVDYGPGVDIWAIGCIFAEITNGQPLFPGESDLDQLAHVMRACGKLTQRHAQIFRRNPLYVGVDLPNPRTHEPVEDRFPRAPASWLQFINACLKLDPEQRETCAGLMQLPYFTEDGFREQYERDLKTLFESEARALAPLLRSSGSGGGHTAPASSPPPAQQPQGAVLPDGVPGSGRVPLPSKTPPVHGSKKGGALPQGSPPAGIGALWTQYLASSNTAQGHQGHTPSSDTLPELGGRGGHGSPTQGQPLYYGAQSPQQPSHKHPTQALHHLPSHGGGGGGAPQVGLAGVGLAGQQPTPASSSHGKRANGLVFPTLGNNGGTSSVSTPAGNPGYGLGVSYKKKQPKKNVLSSLSLSSYGAGGGGGGGGTGAGPSPGGNGGAQPAPQHAFGVDSSSAVLHGSDRRQSRQAHW